MGDTQQLAIPDDASKILRDKLRSLFLEMLPDDQLDDAIKKEWDAFFSKDTPAAMSWGWEAAYDSPHYPRKIVNDDRKQVSPFEHLVRGLLLEMAEAKARECLDEEARQLQWTGDAGKGEILARIVRHAAPELAKAAIEHLVAESVTKVVEVLGKRGY